SAFHWSTISRATPGMIRSYSARILGAGSGPAKVLRIVNRRSWARRSPITGSELEERARCAWTSPPGSTATCSRTLIEQPLAVALERLPILEQRACAAVQAHAHGAAGRAVAEDRRDAVGESTATRAS